MTQEEDELIQKAWDEEIARRIEELDSGKAETIPWDEVRRRVAAKLKR